MMWPVERPQPSQQLFANECEYLRSLNWTSRPVSAPWLPAGMTESFVKLSKAKAKELVSSLGIPAPPQPGYEMTVAECPMDGRMYRLVLTNLAGRFELTRVQMNTPLRGIGAMDREDFEQHQSMTYGIMPTKASYERHYNAIVGASELYTMELVGADEEVVQEAWGEPQFTGGYGKAGYNFDRDELWSLLEKLTNMYNDGNEAAGDLASGVLTTLHFEWI